MGSEHYKNTIQYRKTRGAFFWDYSGIGLLGIDGIHVLSGAIPFLFFWKLKFHPRFPLVASPKQN